jgi:hypothetical protein
MSLVSSTHDLGSFFWHSISLKKESPIFHRYPSHEPDAPYRWSSSLILRLPFTTKGIVVGHWRPTDRTEDAALLAGMAGRDMSIDQLRNEASGAI